VLSKRATEGEGQMGGSLLAAPPTMQCMHPALGNALFLP
jgi:hypothetical protein